MGRGFLTAGSGGWREGGDSSVDLSGVGAGDVVGPAASTDNAFARFDGVTGKLLQNSVWLSGDSGHTTVTPTNVAGEVLTVDVNHNLINAHYVYQGGTGAAYRAHLDNDSMNSRGMQITEQDYARILPMVSYVRQPLATGHVLDIDNDAASTSRSINVDHEGSGNAVHIDDAEAGTGVGLYINRSPGSSAASIGAQVVMGANSSGYAFDLWNTGTGISQNINHAAPSGTSPAVFLYQSGAAVGTNAIKYQETAVNRTAAVINLIRNASATGPMIELTPGGSTVGLMTRGTAVDVSVNGDKGEYYASAGDTESQLYNNGVKVVNHQSTYSELSWGATSCLTWVSARLGFYVDSRVVDNTYINFGASDDFRMRWDTGQNSGAAHAMVIGVSALNSGGFNIIIGDAADTPTVDWGHAAQNNPTLWFQAADGTDTTKWGSLARDDDDFVIGVGAGGNGDLYLNPDGVVKFGSHSAISAETVTGYITIKDSGGTSRKLAVVS